MSLLVGGSQNQERPRFALPYPVGSNNPVLALSTPLPQVFALVPAAGHVARQACLSFDLSPSGFSPVPTLTTGKSSGESFCCPPALGE